MMTAILWGAACGVLLGGLLACGAQAADTPAQLSEGLSGYISMDVPAPTEEYGYGVSLYAAAWPLVERPIADFQIGLASIWIVPENRKIDYPLLPTGTVARDNWPERGPSYRDVFQTIEGGLGFWASTRFGTPTAKFRMNGTADGYNHDISSPGWGFGGTEALPDEEMGIAQLSPRLLVPPDGLTFRNGTCGELLGYAWMVLPLTSPGDVSNGLPAPTGNQSWTLFVNARNFRGPVAFYAPATWSRISRRHPPAVGRGLDARPGLVTGGAIEVNTVPRFAAKDASGTLYARIPQLQFPVDAQGRTVLIHNLTHYAKGALYRQVEAWLAGGTAASGRFDMHAAHIPPVTARPLSLRQQGVPMQGFEDRVETRALDAATFGLQWKPGTAEAWTGDWHRGLFPAYFRREGDVLRTVEASAVPDATGLKAARFRPVVADQAYTSPERSDSAWKRPGAKAGPFHTQLSDGSVVTYWWYRFIDQPALQHAGLNEAERHRLQAAAEKMHRHWTPDREYLPPPARGVLATLDPALLVKPPKGLEIGYVPIVTRQEARR